ncbi:MAG: hypothetical protein GC203_13435 [Phenylobacterium sp.]|uniref:hypothetical protein n=1 Tax=Phenylobacterium sp. TaxID=1871053 RepID=UPI0025DDBC1C|nr:hypothetical protein [Phenylobacterium sp.]MBI1198858.1 hypothetical protein [Phenylobacterium sp.]
MPRGIVLAAAVTLAVAAAPGAQAATLLTVGSNSLCAKGGCLNDNHTYTQTFSAADFSGPVSIGSLKLIKSLLGGYQSNLVKISFQLADGTTLGDWGSFVVAALSGDVVTVGGKSLAWNPQMGDLVVKLDVLVPGAGGGGLARSAAFGGAGGAGPLVLGGGPAAPVAPPPEFGPPAGAPLAAAPEPSAWLLGITGFLAVGAMARRSRKAARAGGLG